MNEEQPNKALVILKQIWPTINKVITIVVYFVINLVKAILSDAMKMIKGG